MFKDCKTSLDTYDVMASIVEAVPLKMVQEDLAETFFNVEKTVEILYNTVILKENCILYGPAGFGKTAVTKAFFAYFGITPFVKLGDSSTDVESLLGIPNMKKLREDSIYEIAFENSIFTSAGPLILEEFLDVNPAVASSLKDIITEGGYRYGNKFTPSKVGPIIICSNKSPDEVSVDLSTAAFYKERFPYSRYIKWDSYNAAAYLSLFITSLLEDGDDIDAYDREFNIVAELCAYSCKDGVLISPRIAIKAVKLLIKTKNIKSLSIISSLDLSKISDIVDRINVKKQNKELNKHLIKLISLLDGFAFSNINHSLAMLSMIHDVKVSLNATVIHSDTVLNSVSLFNNIAEETIDNIQEQFLKSGKNKRDNLPLIKITSENITAFK